MKENKTAMDVLKNGDSEKGYYDTTQERLALLNWTDVPPEILGYGYQFYTQGATIQVKAINVEEMAFFSGLDLKGEISTNEQQKSLQIAINAQKGMNYLLEKCVRIAFKTNKGTKIYSGQQLFFFDKMAVILYLRKHSGLKTPIEVNATCPNKHKHNHPIVPSSFQYKSAELLMSYWNAEEEMFIIKNETFDKAYRYLPETVSENLTVNEMGRDLLQKGEVDAEGLQAFNKFYPFLRNEPSEDNSIEALYKKYLGLSRDDIAALNFLYDHRLKAEKEVGLKCPKCFREFTAPSIVISYEHLAFDATGKKGGFAL